jgi:RNA polymerase sigma-70 factor (ECF subfamily)
MTGEMIQPVSSNDALHRLAPADVLAMYRAHGEFLRRLLLRFGVRESDVDDLLQDVFVVALRRQADFQGRSTVRTWLCGIALRVATGHVNRRRFREILGLSGKAVVEPMTDESGDPQRLIEKAEARRDVQEILDKLSPKKRAVLVLFEIEQLSGEEIAEILGCPVNTVWTRLFHARRDFTTELRRKGLLESGGDR